MKCVSANGVKTAKRGFGYRAIVTAARGRLLIGGVKEIQSAVFCSADLAKQWSRAMRDNNPGSGAMVIAVYPKKRKR